MIRNLQQTGAAEFIHSIRDMIGEGGKRYYVMTFGCQQNEADSERVRGVLAEMGYTAASTPDESDIIIVNTCAIREHAEMKALSIIGVLLHLLLKLLLSLHY